MPMNLLAVIASSRMPMSFRLPEEIDKVRILRTAGLVIACVRGPGDPFTLGGPERAAQVLAITEKGQEELARSRLPDEQHLIVPGSPSAMGFLRAAAERAMQALR
ncbi:hypothetical protein [Variovorax ginsengisoli]|uniref:Uncharacterized protein n=1 Tax=Variovorax ginsengisoli TaxID=363844 RepID=A0ABT8SE06_9BURK|nr:hypothetical protein [Variovorax ginsengisoli]MDN8617991.1 hypothetical protein [Variovorax ginsengisoli]MDO1537161.1 hypothetical protein [Variovorax ginsengisoli]